MGSFVLVKGNQIYYENLYPECTYARGIALDLGIENTLFRNRVIGAKRGIALFNCDDNLIEGNICNENSEYGIYQSNSCSNVIIRNAALNNGICDIQAEGAICGTSQIDNQAGCIAGFN